MNNERFLFPMLCLAVALSVAAHSSPSYPPNPTLESLQELMAGAHCEHPRLLIKPEDVACIRTRIRNSTLHGDIARELIRQADDILRQEPVQRKLEGRRMLAVSRTALARLMTLGMALHLTGNPAYAERGAREMKAIAAFPDWNPSHFLDTAEMTLAMAVGYDWLYKSLDDAMRNAAREAILEKGLRTGLRGGGWVKARNNWGQVCHGGLVAGALAIMEDHPEEAARTLQNALLNIPLSMAAFSPKGAYPEGPGYWGYGTTYNVLMLAVLESTLGTCFGLDRAPGFDQTGGYPALMTGPSGLSFNYADGSASQGCRPAIYWLAARYGRPDWLLGQEQQLRKLLKQSPPGLALPLLFLWMDEAGPATHDIRMPLHWNSESATPVAAHRSSWTADDAVFVGVKAGSPSSRHGHMDIGSFVMDADGVRWATDLGAEGYHRIESRGMNLWSMSQESDRWRIFRLNSFSHNTLVIDNSPQIASGRGSIVRFSQDPACAHTVVDMSPVYAGQAQTVYRGVALMPSGEVLIRDALAGLRPGATVRWGMVTPAAPDKAGTPTLTLRQKDKFLTLRLLQPSGPVWRMFDTAMPKNEWDSPNPGTVMAGFEVVAPDSGRLDLAVILTPGSRTPTPTNRIDLSACLPDMPRSNGAPAGTD